MKTGNEIYTYCVARILYKDVKDIKWLMELRASSSNSIGMGDNKKNHFLLNKETFTLNSNKRTEKNFVCLLLLTLLCVY